MKLQLALDELTLPEAMVFMDKVVDDVDIIEVGTPFLIREGVNAIKAIKEKYPHKEVLADAKIMDGGHFESQLLFDAGADYVTVLGVTDVLTIQSCIRAAKEAGKQVVDMICVDDLPARVRLLEEAGADMLAVHTGTDQQAAGRKPIDDLITMLKVRRKARIAVAGGISSQTVKDYALLGPDVVIVGSAITHAADPAGEARKISQVLLQHH
ncbi:3-hexulose-6-phosphate synthase [Salmonella enterica]|uniref:3-dehydro-L-gulonate-6-phosphate decarboxylase n=2 Tax=Salmonella enterica I TaxID=59201 RepID=A0A3Z7L994_SALET|nr:MULTISPECIES: 3-hexulose-6-phosphate synthase [Salmonella]EAA6828920.1 3-hexulose-6-phosphate synthase [Salmonella enterica subsp. enterica]EEH4561491.1 3-hexulose-6-phosphate synthase [Salmonella enterica subsp. enterica serovar 4,[5],12:i:-]MCL8935068.1 3-hexulose-6-phosphate synthase [Salmonella enterica subsp. enterica serovar Enteritidis]HCG3580322.1 3-hexulose-6-phosphate synthase [Salmonella enterica subsp. enterica serovar Typhi str. AG3]AOZ31847.1 3-hexulose-6-phosphate synthase [S